MSKICQNIFHFIQALQCPTNSMWKRAVGTQQEVNIEPRQFNIFWMVSVVHVLLHIRVELSIFLFFCLVFNSYYWGSLPVAVFCSFDWYLIPIIEVFCLLLFPVLFLVINSLWLNSVLLRFECICRTKSSHRKCYCSHHDLIIHYGISVLQMTMNILRLPNWQSGPFRCNDLSPAT